MHGSKVTWQYLHAWIWGVLDNIYVHGSKVYLTISTCMDLRCTWQYLRAWIWGVLDNIYVHGSKVYLTISMSMDLRSRDNIYVHGSKVYLTISMCMDLRSRDNICVHGSKVTWQYLRAWIWGVLDNIYMHGSKVYLTISTCMDLRSRDNIYMHGSEVVTWQYLNIIHSQISFWSVIQQARIWSVNNNDIVDLCKLLIVLCKCCLVYGQHFT